MSKPSAESTDNERETAAPTSQVRICYDSENLYLAFRCPKVPAVTYNADAGPRVRDADLSHYDRVTLRLDIDRDFMQADKAIKWDSGFTAKTRIDQAKKIWYVDMRIPFAAIDTRKPAEGLEYRLNLYRCQGAKPDRKYIAWQSTGKESFHVPEKFGRMKLE